MTAMRASRSMTMMKRVGDVDHLAQVVAVVARLAEQVQVAQRHRELVGQRNHHRLVVFAEIDGRRILDVEQAEHLARRHQRHREAAARSRGTSARSRRRRGTRDDGVTESDSRVRRSAERLTASDAACIADSPDVSGPSAIIDVSAQRARIDDPQAQVAARQEPAQRRDEGADQLLFAHLERELGPRRSAKAHASHRRLACVRRRAALPASRVRTPPAAGGLARRLRCFAARRLLPSAGWIARQPSVVLLSRSRICVEPT